MSTCTNSLMIIEDCAADTSHLLRLLDQIDHPFSRFECVTTIQEALSQIVEQPPACCLLDSSLPDSNAIFLLKQLQKNFECIVCPIIIITGEKDTKTAIQLMQYGAQDYLIKQDLDKNTLQQSILYSIQNWKLQSQISHLALFDSLTGLVNRALFIDRMSQAFEESKRYKNSLALLYIDLDKFKAVNDTFGHEAGDFLLKSVSVRLQSLTCSTATVARLGGDEFAILLVNIKESKAHYLAHTIICELSMNLPWQDAFIAVSASIGLAVYPSHVKSYQEWMREADFALYRAKNNGRNQYAAFNIQLFDEMQQMALLSDALPKAIVDNHLQIAYQPMINTRTGEVHCVEALIRWRFNDHWIQPEKIIDLIVQKKLSDSFHQWVFESAIAQISQWQDIQPDLNLSLNFPADLCCDVKLLQSLQTAAKRLLFNQRQITVEVTEKYLMDYPDEAKKNLQSLASCGIQISIDDFGTGYSSMQYLGRLPCTMLKIDGLFFRDTQNNQKNIQIIEAMIELAHHLGLRVVAEGIETEALLHIAQRLGCDYAQGYWIGAPIIHQGNFTEFCNKSKTDGDRLMNL